MSLNIPAQAGLPREQAILRLVEEGEAEITWATITSEHAGHRAEFYVFADALKINDIRVNVSARTQQKMMDLLGCMMLTPKLADLMWLQREITLKPQIIRPYSTSTAAMVEHSRAVDKELEQFDGVRGLISTVGKLWVVDNGLLVRPKFAMNYGWHFEGQTFQGSSFEITATRLQKDGKLVRMIQGKGTKHDADFTDYSQVVQGVLLHCLVDGQEMHLHDVLKHPVLSHLANFGGILSVLRQPGT